MLVALAAPLSFATNVSWVVQVCGGSSIASDGSSPAQCDPHGLAPCCGANGVCSGDEAACSCENCTDYRRNRWAADGSCGGETLGTDGISPAACDPSSSSPCCSRWGWCGGTPDHCECDGCTDFRPRWNLEGTCGELSRLDWADEPAECNPNGNHPCCSPYGYCGNTDAHCFCTDCINYASEQLDDDVDVPAVEMTVSILARCGEEAAGAAEAVAAALREEGRGKTIDTVHVHPAANVPAAASALIACANAELPAATALELLGCVSRHECPGETWPVAGFDSWADGALGACTAAVEVRTCLANESPAVSEAPSWPDAQASSACGLDVYLVGDLVRTGRGEEALWLYSGKSAGVVHLDCCAGAGAGTSCDVIDVACTAHSHPEALARGCPYALPLNSECDSDRECNSESCRPLLRPPGMPGRCSLPDPLRAGNCRDAAASPGAVNEDGSILAPLRVGNNCSAPNARCPDGSCCSPITLSCGPFSSEAGFFTSDITGIRRQSVVLEEFCTNNIGDWRFVQCPADPPGFRWAVVLLAALLPMFLVGCGVIWYYKAKYRTSARRNDAQARELQSIADKDLAALPTQMQVQAVEAELRALPEPLSRLAVKGEELTLMHVLGSGAFAEVRLAEWRGTPCAVKRLHRSNLTARGLETFREEIMLHLTLRHPNIVGLYACSINPRRGEVCAVLQLCAMGSLEQLLARERHVELTWSQHKLPVALCVARAVAYLHAQSPPIVHRDLKTANVLIDSGFVARLGDFGLSREYAEDATMSSAGSPLFSAPEVLRRERYGASADVWSFGCILESLSTHRPAYSAVEKKDARRPGGTSGPRADAHHTARRAPRACALLAARRSRHARAGSSRCRRSGGRAAGSWLAGARALEGVPHLGGLPQAQPARRRLPRALAPRVRGERARRSPPRRRARRGALLRRHLLCRHAPAARAVAARAVAQHAEGGAAAIAEEGELGRSGSAHRSRCRRTVRHAARHPEPHGSGRTCRARRGPRVRGARQEAEEVQVCAGHRVILRP